MAVRTGKINKETQYVLNYLGMEEIPYIEDVEDGAKVILVDHNAAKQSPANIANAEILKVIDHHQIDFKSTKLVYYRAEPVGCTSTVLYHLYKENQFEISKKIATLMLSAILSDTLLFKSPTCKEEDKKVAAELAKIAEINVEEYGMEMLKAGTDLNDFSEEELIKIDAKEFSSNGINFEIAQVNTVSIPDVLKRKEKIELAMKKEIEAKGLKLFMFAITDIVNSNSEAIILGERKDIVEKTYKIENNIVVMPGVV